MTIRAGRSLARFVAAIFCVATGQAHAVAPIPVAVSDFDYRDRSGETRDQTREHAERLKSFVSSLRADLAADRLLDAKLMSFRGADDEA